MKTQAFQTSFLSGVLDERAGSRVDTRAYNEGLLEGVNIVPHHLGGVRRRPGLRYRATLPPNLSRLTNGVTETAPNGGTAANANDADTSTVVTTTSDMDTTNPYVVVHYDLGSPEEVLFVDVIGISLSSGTSVQFAIQYSTDDTNWTSLGNNLEIVDADLVRDYRRGSLTPTTARYWRVARIGSQDLGTAKVTLSEFRIWQDQGIVSAVRLIPFELSATDQFVLAITDRAGTIYENGAFRDSIPLPYAATDIPEIDAVVGADALFLVHEDYPPRFVFLESGNQFQTGEIAFNEIPQVDFDDDDSPTPTSEIQVITFAGPPVAGDTFQVNLMGARSAAIAFAGDSTASEQAATAANIAREIQKLYTVRGFDGVSCSRTNTLEYTVTFADASADTYDLMTVTPLSSTSGTATVVRSQAGVSRREPVWSETRGYPRSVDFFGGRLYFGGSRSKQKTMFGSIVNDILDMEVDEGLDDDAIQHTLTGGGGIQQIFSGRTLQIFATDGEYMYVKQKGEPITPADLPENQTKYGAAKIRPVSIDGSTLYVQRNKKSIRDFRYDYEQDAYDSLGVSSLAPDLINSVVDMTAWNGSAVDEISLVYVVNGDGTVAVLNSRKEAEIMAWTKWTTQGLFKAAAALSDTVYFAVRRTINGTDYLFLETADADYYTDSAVQFTNAEASADVTGLDHLDGQECRVLGDGFVLANATPSGGAITLEVPVESGEVGLNFNPTITPMPLAAATPSGNNLMRKKRIVKVRVRVRNTLGLLVNGNLIPDTRLDIDNMDEAPTPFSGNLSLEETTNWDEDEDKLVTFTQEDPLPMEILGLDVEMESA